MDPPSLLSLESQLQSPINPLPSQTLSHNQIGGPWANFFYSISQVIVIDTTWPCQVQSRRSRLSEVYVCSKYFLP